MRSETDTNPGFLSNQKNRLLTSSAIIGASVLLGVGMSDVKAGDTPEKKDIPEFVIGAMEDQIVSEDIEQSRRVAKLIKEAGFNTVKISMPWTYPGQGAEIDNDLKRFQNAVQASMEYDLQFYMVMIPFDNDGSVGQAPVTASQMRRFADTAVSYLHAYNKVNPHQPMIIGLPNEPNLETFWKPQTDSAKKVTRLLSIAYPKLKRNALNLNTEVIVVGPELASYHDDLAYIEEMGKTIKELKIDSDSPIMDVFAWHMYGLKNNDPPEVAYERYKAVKSLVKKHIGDIPVWNTEYGVKTAIPESMKGHYSLPKQQLSTLVSESEQGKYYSDAITMAKCRNMGGIVLFNVIDDPTDYWTSGIYAANSLFTPKASFKRVQQSIEGLNTGNNPC